MEALDATLTSLTARATRIDILCTTLEGMLDRGELWWSWQDRRLHWQADETPRTEGKD
jgi:hypothetical protein